MWPSLSSADIIHCSVFICKIMNRCGSALKLCSSHTLAVAK